LISRQLRDLLLCPENKKEVVFPYQNNVIQVSPVFGFSDFSSSRF
jgi:hypothetical protein